MAIDFDTLIMVPPATPCLSRMRLIYKRCIRTQLGTDRRHHKRQIAKSGRSVWVGRVLGCVAWRLRLPLVPLELLLGRSQRHVANSHKARLLKLLVTDPVILGRNGQTSVVSARIREVKQKEAKSDRVQTYHDEPLASMAIVDGCNQPTAHLELVTNLIQILSVHCCTHMYAGEKSGLLRLMSAPRD